MSDFSSLNVVLPRANPFLLSRLGGCRDAAKSVRYN